MSLLIALLWSSPAQAGELSLAQALDAIPEVRSVQLARARLDSAEGSVQRAGGAFDPTFTASTEASGTTSSGFIAGYAMDSRSTGLDTSVGVQGELASATTWSVQSDLAYNASTTTTNLTGSDPVEQVRSNWSGLVSLQVGQDLLAPWRRSSATTQLRQAREARDLEALSAEQAMQDAVVEVATLWWDLSTAHRQVETLEAALGDAQRLEQRTVAQAEEGEVAPVEVSRVRAERLQAERELLQARAAARSAANSLLSTLGMPLDSDLVPIGEGGIASGGIDSSDTETLAMAADLDVAMARLQVEQAEEALTDARSGRLPSLDLTGSVGVGSLQDQLTSAVTALGTDPLPRWGVGLNLGVPLGGRQAKGGVKEAQSTLTQSEIQLEQAEDTVRVSIRSALDNVEVARAAVTLSEAQLEVARTTEAGEQARLDEGATRLDDLLEARSDRLAAEASARDARMERAEAELELLRQMGRLDALVGLE